MCAPRPALAAVGGVAVTHGGLLLREFDGDLVSSVVATSLIKALSSHGHLLEAWALWNDLRAACLPGLDADPIPVKHQHSLKVRWPSKPSTGLEPWVAADSRLHVRLQASKPDLHMYNLALHVACRLGDSDVMDATFAELRATGLMPDIYTFNVLADAFARAKDVRRAQRVLAEDMKVRRHAQLAAMPARCMADP